MTGQDADERTLEALRNTGAATDEPRLFEHFIYCDDEAGAAWLETQARADGWQTIRVAPGSHGVVASRSDLPVNDETVAGAREFFEKLAGSVPGGDYDGWGAEGA
ncbi:MAG: ribonuclease E inhibitor RraB [Propionibacteriaceae bacterium]|nr:ribonuclease E inhibitor RraB [Propionibacteriaceae bacterium]